MESLKGKTAAVTGGTRGIGRAIVDRLLAEGASVAFCGTTQRGIQQAVNEMEGAAVLGGVCDVSKWEDVRKFFRAIEERFGTLDILVNNAGLGIFDSVERLSPEQWDRMIGVNLNGAFYCTHSALPLFRRAGGGYVINISSLAGKNPFAGGAGYNASKFGLNGFSEALMLDHRHDNVRVSYVMPGSVATDFGSGGGADWKIAPEDIAEIVVSLLRLPERTLVSRVEVRPSKPKK